MICDRYKNRIEASANPDQPLCAPCYDHLHAGGAWARGSPTPGGRKAAPIDLELLPFKAALAYGEVPLYPIAGDFEDAVSAALNAEDDPAAQWRLEAVRWRRQNPGRPLDPALPIIAGWTAARIWRLAEKRQRLAEQAAA